MQFSFSQHNNILEVFLVFTIFSVWLQFLLGVAVIPSEIKHNAYAFFGGGRGGQGHTMCIMGDVLNVSAQFQSRAVPPVLSRDPQWNKSEIMTRVINCTFLSFEFVIKPRNTLQTSNLPIWKTCDPVKVKQYLAAILFLFFHRRLLCANI